MNTLRKRRQIEIEEKFGKPIKDLLTDLYEQGIGIKKISKIIGISDGTAWRWFDELNIQRRDRSAAVTNQWVDNPERREKQRAWLKNVMNKYYSSGGQSPMKNPEVAKKVSFSKMGEKNPMYNHFGKLNPNWKGGKITYRGSGWIGIREQIKRRDNYKCRRCGAKHGLQVHHITPYRETKDNSPENLVTLCWVCHMAVEHKGATWD